MSELRWNPLLETFTIVAANRQGRPNMPKDFCPFCPDKSDKVPSHYDVLVYKNDFPSLSTSSPIPCSNENTFYKKAQAYGVCDVILYSPDHYTSLPMLGLDHIKKLVNLWIKRTIEISEDSKIKYVFVFENRGPEVGVTMPHPHGQIYGYSWIPLKIQTELNNCRNYYQNTKGNLILEIGNEEMRDGRRVIYENEKFVSYIPYFTDYPYGVFIASKQQLSSFADFGEKEVHDFADVLKKITGAMDSLFDREFPYMMCVHQTPVNSEEYKDCHNYYSFHVEFYPPLRSANAIKWYASSEMGAWAAANTRLVEETSEELRAALKKFELQNK
ncbi:MAG: galactose-1-phosphate uridylyltransferase [Cytophagaceae bacterium]|nr:galactose-1-phosphate uridylyltransferase [Cytophagaceae bacterium]MDW8456352.1 galactose-1-phosphate uridylyltransferase [Cytophagaceae bacterium]